MLLFTSSLYVATNLEFKVTSVAVIEFVSDESELPSVPVNTSVVDEEYLGVVNPNV